MNRPPRVSISRTTTGLAALAERVAEVLRQWGMEPIIQAGFYPSMHDVKGMLAGPQNLMGRKERKNSKREGTGCSVFCFFRFFRPTRTTQAVEAIQFDITVLAGKPTNLPYTSLVTLFKGRDEFLAELRQHRALHLHLPRVHSRSAHEVGHTKIRRLLCSQFTISCRNP